MKYSFVPRTWSGQPVSLNVYELRRSCYPNFQNNDLGFYSKQNRSIKYNSSLRVLYVGFYYGDDSYSISVFEDLEEFESFDYRILFIFRFYFDSDDCPEKGFEDYCLSLLYDVFDDVRHMSEYVGYMLVNDNFPTWLPLEKINKSEMKDNMTKNWPVPKRDMYQCITSTSSYRSDYDYMHDEDPSNPKEYMQFIRFIVHSDGVDVDLNSLQEDYDYPDYDVYRYAIPPSLIKVEKSCEMLLDLFKRQMNL